MKNFFFLIGLIVVFFTPAFAEEKNIFQITAVEVASGQNHQNAVILKIVKRENNQPVTVKDLKEDHHNKMQAFIVNSTLTDYSHVYPTPVQSQPGAYMFVWSPKTNGYYRLWVEATPATINQAEFISADLTSPQKSMGVIDRKKVLETTVEGLTFRIEFHPALRLHHASRMQLTILDKTGNPVTELEPILGVFAHVAGFHEDFHSVMHIEPMGQDSKADTDHSVGVLDFKVQPERTGFVRFFVQVLYQGKEISATLGSDVKN